MEMQFSLQFLDPADVIHHRMAAMHTQTILVLSGLAFISLCKISTDLRTATHTFRVSGIDKVSTIYYYICVVLAKHKFVNMHFIPTLIEQGQHIASMLR